MAVSITITETMTEMWDADTDPTFTGLIVDTFAGFQREGTNCLGIIVSNDTQQGYLTVTSFNAENRKIYLWMLGRGEMDTHALGGVRIVAGDGTNRAAYYVGGSDYVPAFSVNGWICYVLDANNLPANHELLAGTEASIDWTAITQVGPGFKTLAKSLGNVENCFFDIARHGTGLNIKGGTSGDPGIWAEIAADDASIAAGKAYGIVMEYQPGVYGIQGDVIFGDDVGTTTTYFKDTTATLVFLDTGALAYNFKVVGNSTGTNTFIDGVAVGSGDTITGRSGSTYLNAGVEVTMDFSDTNVDVLTLYGTKFQLIDQGITFGSTATHVLAGVTFQACGQTDIAAVIARNVGFSETTSTLGAMLWNENINIKNSSYIANTTGAAIQHPSAVGTPYAYDNLQFSGNTYDANNTSGTTIDVNKNNGSNPTTYTGTLVNFIGAAVTTEITVKDINTDAAIEGAKVTVWATTTGNLPFEASVTITRIGDVATVSHSNHGLATNHWVEIKGAVQNEYNRLKQITKIDDSSYSFVVLGSPTTPATGTIISTAVIINGLTNASGQISDTRSYSIDQGYQGKALKGTWAPVYKESPFSGVIDNQTGRSINSLMIPD